MGHVLSVASFIGLPLAAGIGVGVAIQHDVQHWYKHLKKPSWNPPDALFGPVWTVLYTAMGYASYLVFKAGGGPVPLTLYGVQLALNLAWSPLFFKVKEIGFAVADITALVGVLVATIVEFHKVDPTAAYLLLPYLGWTTFAAALTINIYRHNPQERGKKSQQLQDDLLDAAEVGANATQSAADKVSYEASRAMDKLGAAGGGGSTGPSGASVKST
ncbi:hypothetical protein WJX73_006152 [Symbiochloris irregularis]|uniref:Translocator protein n=1 Tax=Symbiochloris irregularis TaxID=706552 RepID=A0AAW1PVH2_9CHLO